VHLDTIKVFTPTDAQSF